MFSTAYASAWHHPGIAWIAGAPLLLFGLLALRKGQHLGDRDPRRRAFVLLFLVLELEILLDAWCTGPLAPMGSTGPLATAATVTAVVLGDLRFFYLVERQRGPAAPSWAASRRALFVALPVSFIVPVASQALRMIDPVRYARELLYLCYELGLLALALVFVRLRRPLAVDGADRRDRYLGRLLRVEIAQYGLWIIADAFILRALDVGYLVRMLANAIYYAAFVPLATLRTPEGTRA